MDFKSAFEILWRRRMVIATALVVGLVVAAVVFTLTPTTYQATSSVMLVGLQSGRDPSMSNVDMPTLATSTAVLTAVQRDLKTNEPVAALAGNLTMKAPTWGSNVMPITYTDRRPRRAVLGANAVANELSQFYRQLSGARYDALEKYLNSAMEAKRAKLGQLDRKLQNAAVADPYLDQTNASSAIGTDLLALERQRDQAEAIMIGDRAQAGAESQHLSQISPIARAEKTQNNPLYLNLRTQQAKDAAQLKILQSQYSKAYPGLPGLQDTVKQENAAVTAAANAAASDSTSASPTYIAALSQKFHADATLAGDSARVAALDSQIQQAQAHLHQVPGAGVSVAALRRDRDAAELDYQALSSRLTATLATQAESAALGSVQVVDQATSAQSTVSKHASLLLGGAVVGFLVLGVTLAFLLELMDDRLRSRDRVEGLYGKPVLGSVGI